MDRKDSLRGPTYDYQQVGSGAMPSPISEVGPMQQRINCFYALAEHMASAYTRLQCLIEKLDGPASAKGPSDGACVNYPPRPTAYLHQLAEVGERQEHLLSGIQQKIGELERLLEN